MRFLKGSDSLYRLFIVLAFIGAGSLLGFIVYLIQLI